MRYRIEPAPNQRPTVPARAGTGSRTRRPATRSDGLLLWRMLGTSAAGLILGLGGLLAYTLVTPPSGGTAPKIALANATPPAASAPSSATPSAPSAPQAVATPDTSASAKVAVPVRPPRIGEAGHSQSALKVASILGAGGDTAGQAVDPGPTAADFARPAFLEPIGDAADDDAALPAEAVETVGEGTPPAGIVPLPAPRPLKMASADAGADGNDEARAARIRSAVTMRSGPRRSASAIGTLEAGTKVKLYSCKSWCDVASGDKRGWVYKSAVDR